MEKELTHDNLLLNRDYYEKSEYIGQDITKSPSYKKWYENCKKKVIAENERRSKITLMDLWENDLLDNRFLWIFYCPNCTNYCTCSSYDLSLSFVECNKCKTVFCPGCNFIITGHGAYTICLKGFFKLWWLRVKYQRVGLINSNLCYYIMHIMFVYF